MKLRRSRLSVGLVIVLAHGTSASASSQPICCCCAGGHAGPGGKGVATGHSSCCKSRNRARNCCSVRESIAAPASAKEWSCLGTACECSFHFPPAQFRQPQITLVDTSKSAVHFNGRGSDTLLSELSRRSFRENRAPWATSADLQAMLCVWLN